MEQLPNWLMFKIWPILYSQNVVLIASRLLVLIGSIISLHNMISLKIDIPGAIIASMSSMMIQKPTNNGLTVYKSP